MSPSISCLLPAYNAERYLEEAVRSIFNQTTSDWELIVINDGSKDATAEILQRLSTEEPRLKVLTQPNKGIVSALNAGLKACRGQFIARMDADDISFPSRFEQQLRYLIDHPGCVLVGGTAVSSKFGESRAGAHSGSGHQTTDLSRFPPRVAVSVHPLIMMRHEVLKRVGGYSDKYPHAEDYDLFIRVSRYGAIVNLPIDMLFYRRHENQVSWKYLELQERSAARAEANAFQENQGKTIGAMTFEAYVYLRIWRRYIAFQPTKAVKMLPHVVRYLCRVVGTDVWSNEYSRVRLIFLANLIWLARSRFG